MSEDLSPVPATTQALAKTLDLGFYTGFANWALARFPKLAPAERDDFLAAIIALFIHLGPVIDDFPKKVTLRAVYGYFKRHKDPLKPFRDGIRGVMARWGE